MALSSVRLLPAGRDTKSDQSNGETKSIEGHSTQSRLTSSFDRARLLHQILLDDDA